MPANTMWQYHKCSRGVQHTYANARTLLLIKMQKYLYELLDVVHLRAQPLLLT